MVPGAYSADRMIYWYYLETFAGTAIFIETLIIRSFNGRVLRLV
jgi:hypothetical protein